MMMLVISMITIVLSITTMMITMVMILIMSLRAARWPPFKAASAKAASSEESRAGPSDCRRGHFEEEESFRQKNARSPSANRMRTLFHIGESLLGRGPGTPHLWTWTLREQ